MAAGENPGRTQQQPQEPVEVPPNAFRVLVTGFGPFMHYDENPSWLAVKPLQNVILHTHITPEKVQASIAAATSSSSKASSSSSTTNPKTTAPPIPPLEVPKTPRPIHITTLQIPVLYEAVLGKVPPLHLRPPILPDDAPPDCAPPPPNGYDFVFHIGVAGRGPLRMERVGHKLGYHMKDASGKYAPVVKVIPKDFSRREGGGNTNVPVGINNVNGSQFAVNGNIANVVENAEREKSGLDGLDGSSVGGTPGDSIGRPTRGFGIGYENCQDEYTTDIDVTRLVSDMKKEGVEQIYSSMDAGHYLCDFIYYCSLAEVMRSIKPYEEKRWIPQVLFLHCPPVGQPLTTEDVTEAIKKIIIWVCGEIVIQELRAEVVAAAGGTPGAPPPVSGSSKSLASKKPGPVGGSRA